MIKEDGRTGRYSHAMAAEVTSTYRWSRERYDRAVETGVFEDARVELLDGEIVAMPPQSNEHSATTRWLRTHFVRGLDPDVWLVGSHEPRGVHPARGDVLTVPGTDLTVDVSELLGP
jgi:hypothetical protein